MIKNILWDWNGTILNDVSLNLFCVNKIRELYCRLPYISIDEYRQKYTFPIRDFYKDIGMSGTLEFKSLVTPIFFDLYNDNFDLTTVSLNLWMFDFFKNQDVNHYILSAREQSCLVNEIQRFGIAHLFQDIFGAIEGKSKLIRGQELLIKHNILTKETILVGDTISDYEIASSLKINHLLLSMGHQSEDRLKKISSFVFNDKVTLKNAIHVISESIPYNSKGK